MSIKSTHYVTREFAIEAIYKKLEEVEELNNEDLSELLEDVIHNGFYNFTIVGEEEISNLQENGYPTLTSTWDLPPRNDAW